MISEKIERKLQYFANTMQHEVETKKLQSKLEASSTQTKSVAAILESTTRHNKVMLQAKRNELQRSANRQIAKAKVHSMTKYVETRKQQIDKLFVDVAAQLAQFTQSDKYEDYLLEQIKKVMLAYKFAIIQLSPLDMRLEDAVKIATGLTLEIGEHDFIGGFVLLNESRSVRADHTFKTRLLALKKDFAYDQEEKS